jgi:hypothetical protein
MRAWNRRTNFPWAIHALSLCQSVTESTSTSFSARLISTFRCSGLYCVWLENEHRTVHFARAWELCGRETCVSKSAARGWEKKKERWIENYRPVILHFLALCFCSFGREGQVWTRQWYTFLCSLRPKGTRALQNCFLFVFVVEAVCFLSFRNVCVGTFFARGVNFSLFARLRCI